LSGRFQRPLAVALALAASPFAFALMAVLGHGFLYDMGFASSFFPSCFFRF